MPARYIIRFDDASEYMDNKKWDPFLDLIDRYSVSPIIAVIPYNSDPKMISQSPDSSFWDKVREWQKKNYRIGLHGYKHKYTSSKSGLIGLNRRSEFAGLPLEEQKEMLAAAYQKFAEEGIRSDVFVAPAHSFDRNTLEALKAVTEISHISDGYYLNPVIRSNFKWIPQQLWGPVIKKRGVWTICYHPGSSDQSVVNTLEAFLRDHHSNVADPLELEFGRMKIEDFVYSSFMLLKNKLRNLRQLFLRH